MWMILLQEFWGDLKTQKTRAFLTIFAITWGTIAIVLMLSFGEGLKDALVRGSLGAGSGAIQVWGGETGKLFDGLPRGRPIRLVEDDVDLILRSIPEVEMISPSFGRRATLRTPALRTSTFMEGVYPDFEEMRTMYPVSGGRFINARDEAEKRRVVFLGDSIAKRLFPEGDAIGNTLMIDDVPFTVVGTMQPKLQTSMNNGPDADRAIIPASTFQTIYGHRYVSHLLVRPTDVTRTAELERKIYEVLGRRYRFDPTDERALTIWDLAEEERMVRNIGLGIQIFLGIVGGLTLLVAGVGVANIMYVVVRERTREIGTKIAVGARRRHIMAQFIFEALVICLAGGLIGMLFSGAVVLAVDSMPVEGEAAEFLANPRLSWPIALGTVGILTAIGLAAGVFPARKAAAVDPVESLRWE